MPVSVQFSINGRRIHRGMGYAFYNVFRPAPGRRLVIDGGNPPTITDPTDPEVWVATHAMVLGEVILDSNKKVQLVTTAGTTGGTAPTWSPIVGGSTTDATVVWKNLGHFPGITRASSTAYLEDDQVRVSNDIHICIVPGTSGGSAPTWKTGVGEITLDGTVEWLNLGPTLALGATDGAVDVNAEGASDEVTADQSFSPLGKILTGQKAEIGGSFKELSLELLSRAMPDVAYATGTDAALPTGAQSFREITAGGLASFPTPALAVLSPKADFSNPYKYFVFCLYKGAAEGGPGLGFTRTKETLWKAKWTGLAVMTRITKDQLWNFYEQI
jgi:hypothetical protein